MMQAQRTGGGAVPTSSNLGTRRGLCMLLTDSSKKYSVAREQCKMNPVLRFHATIVTRTHHVVLNAYTAYLVATRNDSWMSRSGLRSYIHILGVIKGGEDRFRTAASRYSSPLRLLFPHTPRGLRKGNNTLLWVIRPGNFLSPTFPLLFILFLFPYHITCMCYCTGQKPWQFFYRITNSWQEMNDSTDV